MWDAESASEIRNLIGIVADEGIGVAAGASAQADKDLRCNLELLLLPLADRGTVGVRILGMLAPLRRPYWLGIRPVQPLRLGVLQFVGQPSVASLATEIAPPPPNMRIRRTFTVIDGGRT